MSSWNFLIVKILGHSLNMWGAKFNNIIPTVPSISRNQLLFKVLQTNFRKQIKKGKLSHLHILALFYLRPNNLKVQEKPGKNISDPVLEKCFVWLVGHKLEIKNSVRELTRHGSRISKQFTVQLSNVLIPHRGYVIWNLIVHGM